MAAPTRGVHAAIAAFEATAAFQLAKETSGLDGLVSVQTILNGDAAAPLVPVGSWRSLPKMHG